MQATVYLRNRQVSNHHLGKSQGTIKNTKDKKSPEHVLFTKHLMAQTQRYKRHLTSVRWQYKKKRSLLHQVSRTKMSLLFIKTTEEKLSMETKNIKPKDIQLEGFWSLRKKIIII